MNARVLGSLVVVSACNSYDPAADLSRIESGTTWQLSFGSGTGQFGAGDDQCRTFASKTRQVPADGGDCDPGCSCSLQFSNVSDNVQLDFYEWCTDPDRWELSCWRDDATSNSSMICSGQPSAVLWNCLYAGTYQQL